jgi:diacylglycerol kinase (ATP)
MKILKDRKNAFGFAFSGIQQALKKEANLQIEFITAGLVILCGLHFSISKSEWLAVLICITLVICFEIFNTAIEEICDLVSREQHPVIKYIKDISAAAVLISCILAVVVGLIVFIPYFFAD